MRLIFQRQIPAKLILFGEWAILEGKRAIGCSLGKYFSCRLESSDHNSGLIIQGNEEEFQWNEVREKPPPFLARSLSILEFLYSDPLTELRGCKLQLDRAWDLSEGLGSSSALFLALNLMKNPHLRAEEARRNLVTFQKCGSGFDLLLQAQGGFLCAKIDCTDQLASSITEPLALNIPSNLLLIHTGKKLDTTRSLSQVQKTPHYFSSLKALGDSVEKFLNDFDWERAVSEHYLALHRLGVVPEFVVELRQRWIERNWISTLKTTGAGGGDTLLLLIHPQHRPKLEEDIQRLGFWIESSPLGVPGALS